MRIAMSTIVIVLALSGCGVGTVVNIATAPVRVAGKAVDLATTSQSERDENRGRELRRLEERYGKLDREYAKQDKRCSEGQAKACERRDAIAAEMSAIRPQLPAGPE